MKKHTIQLAGLALAATLNTLPTFAQKPGPPSTTPPPPKHVEHVEIEAHDDEDGPFAIARAGIGDVERNVRRIFAGPGDGGDRPLIISSSTPDEKSLATLDEDLNIMARVLDKSVDRGSHDDGRKAMGIQLWATGGGNRARNLYIEGHGAIFILNVPFPLLAPPSKPQVEEKKEAASSTWEEARNELYGREDDRPGMKRKSGDKRLPVPFEAERVEDLKRDLSEALKNATHIRGLKDNETVTVVVQGAGSGSVQRARVAGPKGEGEDLFAFAFAPGGGGARSVMTLRAKKSDIDAFAKGKTELDDFRRKVSVATYQAPSGGDAVRIGK